MILQDAYDKRKEMWASMDVNGNGYLSLAEVTKVTKSRGAIKVEFQHY